MGIRITPKENVRPDRGGPKISGLKNISILAYFLFSFINVSYFKAESSAAMNPVFSLNDPSEINVICGFAATVVLLNYSFFFQNLMQYLYYILYTFFSSLKENAFLLQQIPYSLHIWLIKILAYLIMLHYLAMTRVKYFQLGVTV